MNTGTEGIRKQAQELIEQAYQRGYKDGENSRIDECAKALDEAVIAGRNEAWEAAKKIYLSENNGGLPANELRRIFNVEYNSFIIKIFSASEAIEKLRKYEEQKKQEEEEEIKVGDEVVLHDGDKAVVTEHHSDRVCVVRYNGCTSFKFKDDMIKTGRTFPEIAEVLKKLKEDEELIHT